MKTPATERARIKRMVQERYNATPDHWEDATRWELARLRVAQEMCEALKGEDDEIH